MHLKKLELKKEALLRLNTEELGHVQGAKPKPPTGYFSCESCWNCQ